MGLCLGFSPVIHKNSGGMGNGVKTSAKFSFSMSHSKQSVKMQRQLRHIKWAVDLFPFLTQPNHSDSVKK